MGLFQDSNQPTTRLNGIRLSEAVLGVSIPVLIGQHRLSWKLLWYGAFTSSVAKQQGGGGSGSGKGGTQWVYSASVVGGLCMGPCVNFLGVWDSNGRYAMDTNEETTVVPSAGPYQYTPLDQPNFAQDLGVGIQQNYNVTVNDFGSPGSTTLSGTQTGPLVYTTSLTPGPGQYTIIGLPNNPVYVFNAAQAGATVVINYSAFRYFIQQTELAIAAASVTVEYESTFQYNISAVYYPSGVALTVVSGTPSVAGTYNPNGGNYLFAPADYGQGVSITYVYKDVNTDTNAPNTLNLTFVGGEKGQSPWSYLSSGFPAAALGYTEYCYIASMGLYLGYSPVLPQYNFEILGPYSFGAGIGDANPADAIYGLLTNPMYKYNTPQPVPVDISLLGEYTITGAITSGTFSVNEVVKQTTTGATATLVSAVTGTIVTGLISGTPDGANVWTGQTSGATFTPNALPTSPSARAMWSANSFFISDILDSQTSLMDTFGRWCEAGQVYISYDEGRLKFIPLCDTTTVGNGVVYSPPTQPVIDLDDDDFNPEPGKDPITIEQTPWQNRWNRVGVRWSVRTNNYNEDILQIQDEAGVQQYGLMSESAQDWQFICTEDAAQFAANMRLQRYSAIYTKINTTLKSNFAFLSPGDIITATDGLLGTSGTLFGRTPFRITRMVDDPVKGIIIEAENFPWSVGTSLLYNKQAQNPSNVGDGPQEDPGFTTALIFEVPDEAAQFIGDTLYIFANGANVNWGGFQVYVSFNGTDYNYYGQYSKAGKIGVTTADFPGGSSSTGGGAKLYVFNPPAGGGSHLSTIYANADGAAISIPWSADNVSASLGGWETSSGSASAGYNFTDFDSVINAQIGYGASSIVLILAPISFGGSNDYTPNYVFTTGWATSISSPTGQLYTAADSTYPGAGTIASGHAAQGVDNTAFPAAWQAPFVTAWKAAVAAAINHVKAASYASKIAYIRVGGGCGGEWLTYAPSGLETLCSPANSSGLETAWTGYMSAVESEIIAQATGLNFVQSTNGGLTAPFSIPYSFADAEAAIAASNGFGIGDQGLQNNDIQCYTTNGTTSGGSAFTGFTSNDFAYTMSANAATIKECQTYAASNPSYVGNPPRNTMGSLVPLLPFAIGLGVNHFELYYADWQVAFDPSSSYYTAYSAAYQAAFASARAATSSGNYPPGYLDTTDTLAVNMQQSGATLQSVTAADRDAYVTLSAIVSEGAIFDTPSTATEGENIGISTPGPGGSQGPNAVASGSDGGSYGQTSIPWINPGDVTGSSGYATCTLNSNQFTHRLFCENPGLTIPSASPIVSVTVTCEAYATAAIQLAANLIVGGSPEGFELQLLLGTSPTAMTFSSTINPDWGLALDGAEVNASNFGVQFTAYASSGPVTIYIQNVKISVTYAGAGGAITWVNPGNVSSTSAYATAALTASAPFTLGLLAFDFNAFNIPFGFVLTGFQVLIDCYADFQPNTANISVSLSSIGQLIGTTKTSVMPFTVGTLSFGSSTDTWGSNYEWDVDSLNAQGPDGFAIFIQVAGIAQQNINVRNVRVIVFGSSLTNLELVSYETATLVGLNTYDLTSIRRGILGSYPCDHPAGSAFARMDEASLSYQVPANFVGESIYFKFLSFNAYGNQLQSLAEVPAVEVPITGLSPGAIDAGNNGALLTGTPNFTTPEIENVISAVQGNSGVNHVPYGYALVGLTPGGGTPEYAQIIAGGSPGNPSSVVNFIVLEASANTTAAAWDFIEVNTSSGNVTITLPLATANGDTYIGVKKVSSDTNSVLIATSGSDTVELASFNTQDASYYFASDGVNANWFIDKAYVPSGGGGLPSGERIAITTLSQYASEANIEQCQSLIKCGAGNNEILGVLMVVDEEITVSSLTVSCSGNSLTSGNYAGFALYNFARTQKLIDASQMYTQGTATGPKTITFTPVTLQPGSYWFCSTCTQNLNITFYGPAPGNAYVLFLNNNSVKIGTSSTTSSSGNLPAVSSGSPLGAFTTQDGSGNYPPGVIMAIFE